MAEKSISIIVAIPHRFATIAQDLSIVRGKGLRQKRPRLPSTLLLLWDQ